MSDALRHVQEECADCMDRVLAHFKKHPPVFITVVVRTHGEPTRDFMMTSDDDLDALVDLIRRRQALGHEGPAPTQTSAPASEDNSPGWLTFWGETMTFQERIDSTGVAKRAYAAGYKARSDEGPAK